MAQTLNQVQGDGRSLNGLATYGIFGATRDWSEGETSPLDCPLVQITP
ncbi:MAG: hypothetical protein II039_01425 [Treponema sp.]|nr:hypothetical protein [Treponema sp.]